MYTCHKYVDCHKYADCQRLHVRHETYIYHKYVENIICRLAGADTLLGLVLQLSSVHLHFAIHVSSFIMFFGQAFIVRTLIWGFYDNFTNYNFGKKPLTCV